MVSPGFIRTSELFVDYFRVFVHPYLRQLGEPNGLLLLDNVSQHYDDDVFYLFLQKQKIVGSTHPRNVRGQGVPNSVSAQV
jgi:RNA binding exosome subunit